MELSIRQILCVHTQGIVRIYLSKASSPPTCALFSSSPTLTCSDDWQVVSMQFCSPSLCTTGAWHGASYIPAHGKKRQKPWVAVLVQNRIWHINVMAILSQTRPLCHVLCSVNPPVVPTAVSCWNSPCGIRPAVSVLSCTISCPSPQQRPWV